MTRSITKFAAACLVTLGLASASYAQGDNDIIRPITTSGSAAFIFSLNGLGDFNIGGPLVGATALPESINADGTSGTMTATGGSLVVPGIGMKFFVSDNTALRLALAFRLYEDGKEDVGASAVGGPGKVQRNTTGINLGAEYHFRPLYSTSPYIGALISFVTDNHKRVYTPTPNNTQTTNLKSTSFGVGAVGGFNWFFTRGIAIGAEYGLGFTTTSSVVELPQNPNKTDEPVNTDVGLGIGGGGAVHLVVYF